MKGERKTFATFTIMNAFSSTRSLNNFCVRRREKINCLTLLFNSLQLEKQVCVFIRWWNVSLVDVKSCDWRVVSILSVRSAVSISPLGVWPSSSSRCSWFRCWSQKSECRLWQEHFSSCSLNRWLCDDVINPSHLTMTSFLIVKHPVVVNHINPSSLRHVLRKFP